MTRAEHRCVAAAFCVAVAVGCSSGTSPTPLPPSRVTLTGTVTAAATQRIIQDVHVVVVAGVNAGRETFTSGAGVYTLTDLVPGTMTLQFTSSGYVDLQRTTNVQRDATLDLQLVRGPEPGFILSGRVTTLWGDPIDDVGVEAVHEGRVFGGGTTNRSGIYSIPTLPAQDYIVRAIKFGYQMPQLPFTLTNDAMLDIQMDRVRIAIFGSVEEAAPCFGVIAGARVEVVDGPDAGAAAMSDASAAYSLPNLNWGTFMVRASKTGYTPIVVSMNAQPPGSGNPPAPATIRQDFRLQRMAGC